ncbi:GGDEF domain-containing protein [Tardiphaga sp. 709]|uniref:GGDEF domain-containing protein n=1 Tax=Tardiphaga sp. 709 TaxID=3076039 RepID=UPI0028E5FF48|nr:GGDEF domain-containing protein [Tardiphaga sp. 709]WNV10241.1 GGDEF domain-containing protein [Tardiphaga sp. 709]
MSTMTIFWFTLANFLSSGLVWAYVARCYPNFVPARYWSAASLSASAGSALGLLFPNPIGLLFAAQMTVLAFCLSEVGIRRFYDRPTSWIATALVISASLAGFMFFRLVIDEYAMRVVVYSLSQGIPVALTLPLLLSRDHRRSNHGARMAGYLSILLLVAFACRAIAALLHLGGSETTMVTVDAVQAGFMLVAAFLAMTWNYGLLMMAIDRLRGDAAELALIDDLTGAGNRRRLLQRMDEECAMARRTARPYALLAIDLDGFKAVNDGFGHSAGDDCLRQFAQAAQDQLRPGDTLARCGGDEFCIVLPDTDLQQAGEIARRVLAACPRQFGNAGHKVRTLSASIGVAQWSSDLIASPERLMAAADHALYQAKHSGKNRVVLYEPAPPLAPIFDDEIGSAPLPAPHALIAMTGPDHHHSGF